MASNRYINIAIQLFEHDDEQWFLESIIDRMEELTNEFDIASITITTDVSYHNYMTDEQKTRIRKLGY